MKGTMRAQMFYAPGDVRYEKTEIPKIKEDEVLVKVKAALTCGTDLKTYRRGHPTIIEKVPSTFGHEFAGDVIEVGKNVTKFKVGDRIVGANSAPCFECHYCKQERYSLCENLHYLNGAYSEYVAIPSHILKYNFYRIPDNLKYEEAALLEPLACAVHGAERIPTRMGDYVVVIGAGPIGMMFMKLLSLKGCRVIAVDLSESRLEQAYLFGAIATVNANNKDHIQEVRNLCDGFGASIVVEATGFPNVWENAIEMVTKGGTVLAFGGTKKGTSIQVDCQKFHYEEINLKAVYHHTPYHVQMALNLLSSGQVLAKDFISGYYPLSKTIDALEKIGIQEGIKYAILPEMDDE